MTSFLIDVLSEAGKTAMNDLNTKINNIRKEIDNLQKDTKEFLDEYYINFSPMLKKDQVLMLQAEKLMRDMKSLQEKVDDQIKIKLTGYTKELKSHSDSLKELSLSLNISQQLLETHAYRGSIKKYMQNKQHLDVAKILRKMKNALCDSQTDLQSLEIIELLKMEYVDLHARLDTDINILWQKYVCLKGSKNLDFELTIKGEEKEVQDLILAMHYNDNLDDYIVEFSTILLKYIIKPIVCYKCLVEIKNKKLIGETPDKTSAPDYKCTLHNLKMLFMFLHDYLSLSEDKSSYFFKRLRVYLIDDFSASLIADCISRTIPISSSELKNFAPIRAEFIEFENYLISIGFLSSDMHFLSDYTKNVDKLYMQKICQEYLARGRDIMKKDLHDSIKHVDQEPSKFSEEVLQNYDFHQVDRKLSNVTFKLPTCQISKSVQEVLDLVKEILDEACQNSGDCAIRLFYTSRDIFEMYIGAVPLHHKKFLETIPQQVALFHNNCMYLAHHLLTLAYEYENKFPKIIQEYNLTYADQILILRSIGTEHLLNQMKYQKNIILDILRESGLSSIGQFSELPVNTEKALRQCIRQLELLKTVWLDVLPEKIYCKALSCIMNSMIDDLITKVTSVEDIPANVATDLVTLFNVIIRRAPIIFPNPDTIQEHVRKWRKLKELVIILGASLIDIEIRWADGKGPLAQNFSADHVRQLIKALFQNTDRRSTLLSKIK